MFSSIRHFARFGLSAVFLIAASSVVADETREDAPAGEEQPVAQEIIIDDSGIIVREGDAEVIVEEEDEDGRRLNVRVDTRGHGVVNAYGDDDEQVTFGEDVTVEEDEVVHQDMVILFGDLDVYGEIVGNVVVVMGDVYVYEGAIVTGDLLVVGGEVEREEGSRIVGEVTRSSTKLGRIFDDEWQFDEFEIHGPGPFSAGQALLKLFEFLAIALAGQLLLASRMSRFTAGLRLRPGRSFLVGLLTLLAAILLLVPAAILLLVLVLTVVGIPVAFLVVLGIVGLGFMAWLVPLYTFSRYSFEARGMNRYLSVGIWAAIFWFVHTIVGAAGPLIGLVILIEIVLFLFGLGAMVVTRLGNRHLLVD